jgi:diacylglycerol kinase family enzyme
VTLVGNVSTLTFIKKSLQLRKLKQIKHPQVFYYKTKKLKIVSNDNKNAFVEADGEFFGYTPVDVSVLPKKIKILQ